VDHKMTYFIILWNVVGTAIAYHYNHVNLILRIKLGMNFGGLIIGIICTCTSNAQKILLLLFYSIIDKTAGQKKCNI